MIRLSLAPQFITVGFCSNAHAGPGRNFPVPSPQSPGALKRLKPILGKSLNPILHPDWCDRCGDLPGAFWTLCSKRTKKGAARIIRIIDNKSPVKTVRLSKLVRQESANLAYNQVKIQPLSSEKLDV